MSKTMYPLINPVLGFLMPVSAAPSVSAAPYGGIVETYTPMMTHEDELRVMEAQLKTKPEHSFPLFYTQSVLEKSLATFNEPCKKCLCFLCKCQ